MYSVLTVSQYLRAICFLHRKINQNPVLPKIFLANAPIFR